MAVVKHRFITMLPSLLCNGTHLKQVAIRAEIFQGRACTKSLRQHHRHVAPPSHQRSSEKPSIQWRKMQWQGTHWFILMATLCQSCHRLGRKKTSGQSVETCFWCLTCNVQGGHGTCFMDHILLFFCTKVTSCSNMLT